MVPPSAPSLLLSLLSILEDRRVSAWISASALSRHKVFGVARGRGERVGPQCTAFGITVLQ